MWEKLRVVFTIPELRKKILFTLALLLVYRVGWQIPLPVVDQSQTKAFFSNTKGLGALFEQVAVFGASQLNQITIFGLGIMPYISASIIFQLLGSVWAPLERLQKEGESGRKKINEYTRYATVVLCIGQSWMYLGFLLKSHLIKDTFLNEAGNLAFGWQLVTVLTMTAGTIFLMWLGEQIDEFGIGNGISLLIMAGILAGMPGAFKQLLERATPELGSGSGKLGIEVLLLLAVLFLAVVAGVVFITLGQRRIPTQSAKHVRGRRVYGGTRQYLPLRVNQAGVMPIIFASSLLMFPSILFTTLAQAYPQNALWAGLHDSFTRGQSFVYNLLYVVLIYFFCYFWTAITFNPKDMSENLKGFGTFIPGYRPGKRTADYLEKVMVRITYVGAGFLAVVAVTPTVIAGLFDIPPQVASFFGGTGLLIAVSVAFDLVQKIDSHLVMRNYRGLLKKRLRNPTQAILEELLPCAPGAGQMRLIFLGPPGAGKGTQSQRLLDYLKVPHIATGDMLRRAVQLQTEEGRASEEYMKRGRLVPDPIILQMVGARLAQPDTRQGYLFDGFPRNQAQAQALDEFLKARGIPLNGVLELKVDRDELVKRLSGRQRADDQPDVIRQRLDGYLEQTAPLEEYYRQRGLLHPIDGSGTPDEVFARIRGVVEKLERQDRPAGEKSSSD